MKRKIITGLLITSIFGIGVTNISALSYQSKAEKLAELTNKPLSEILIDRFENNKTFGEIANENNVLEEFKSYNYENKKNIVLEKVNNGILTDEEGKKILEEIEERQSNCDGTGNKIHIGLGLGNGRRQRKLNN